MRRKGSAGFSIAYTFCLWEGLLEEAEAIAARLPDVALTGAAITEQSVREFCKSKYRSAVALSIGLMSLECLVNEYLLQKSAKRLPGYAVYQRLSRPTLEHKVRIVCAWLLKNNSGKKFLQKLLKEILPMRDFLLELKAIPYNFDLSRLTRSGSKARNRPEQAFSNLNRTFVLDSIHAIRSLADILSSSRVGMPKPMVFVRLGAKQVA